MRLVVLSIIAAAGVAVFAPGASAAVPDNGICFVAGPYQRESRARDLAGILRNHGLEGKTARHPTLTLFYRVVLDDFDSPAQAGAAARRLRRDGVRDLLVVRQPGAGHAPPWISLGVFRSYSDALRRNEQAAILGFNPRIRQDYLGVPLWYVEVAAPADVTAFAAITGTVPRTADCALRHRAPSSLVHTAGVRQQWTRIVNWNVVRQLFGLLHPEIAQVGTPPPG